MDAYLQTQGAALPGVIVLDGARTTIGRAADADIALSADATVSRLHAAIEHYPGGWVLRDLGSTNGTFVNGERVVGERPLAERDEIRVGSTVFVFHANTGDGAPLATIQGPAPPELTKREHEVLLELCRPLVERTDAFPQPSTVAQIADRLVIGRATVKFHLENLFDKFGLTEPGDARRLTLANEALRRGAVSLSQLRQG